jgi:nucleoside 2-deoxyribosyltransferase
MFDEKPQAFLALPVKDATSQSLAGVISDVLRSQGVEPILPAETATTGPLAEQIQDAIRRANLVVADLTGASPHVLFEVGLALGLNKPVLLLSQAPGKDVLPIGLQAYQVAVYRPDDVATVRRYVELWLRDFLKRRETA